MRLLVATLIGLLANSYAIAEITTKEESEEFLAHYCIALVREIAKTTDDEKTRVRAKDWKGALVVDSSVKDLADLYHKLCR